MDVNTPAAVVPAIDYGRFDGGKGAGVNYWKLDPVLRFEARRIYGEDEFAWGRERLSDFGRAVVARRFVDRYLRDRPGRGITGGDRLPVERFDAIVRFATVPSESLSTPAEVSD